MPIRQAVHCYRYRRSARARYLLFGFLFLLTGCNRLIAQPLPTYAPRAATVAIRSSLAPQPIPSTFTVVAPAQAVLVSQAIRTATPRPSPTLRPTATLTPSPISLPGRFPLPVEAPYMETPPATTPCDGQGTYFRSRFPSQVGGRWREHHVYLPPCYGHDTKVYPVMYLIHGSIQTDSHWLDLGLAAYADAGINSGRYPPFIAIMPFSGQLGNQSSGGENSIEGITVNYLLPYVDNTYCTWATAAGRSIGGISRGGYWALETAFNHPDLFSAVSGHSSHLRFETDPARYNPLATYATADLDGIRIWMDRGEKDFLRVGQEQLHERLTAAGIPHEYRVNPGGHSDSYWAEHLAEYLDWHAAGWPKDREALPECNH